MAGANGTQDTLKTSVPEANGHAENDQFSDARHLIEVQETAYKGLGVFAKELIPRGTRILCERLLLPLNGGEDPREIMSAVERLSDADKKRYFELHPFAAPIRKQHVQKYMKKRWDQVSEYERRAIGIYDANSFEVGVFFLPSRVNHSCIPNAHYEFNPTLERGTYHAVRDIQKGEEVFISYIHGGTRVKSWRQPKLDVWGFVCTCPACENSEEGKKREARRQEMYELDQKLAVQSVYGTEMTPMQALKTATKLASLLAAEGVLNRELRLSYHDAARYSLELKNVKMAILWVQKEVEHERTCLGEDHPVYQAAAARLNLLKEISEGKATWEVSMSEYFQ